MVNSVGETSVPADIARGLAINTDVKIDILAWFTANEFDNDSELDVTVLDAPDTALGIDRDTYRRAKSYLKDYDFVQAHHNHSGSFAKAICAKMGVPSISREGNMRIGFSRKGLIANGLTNPLADRVVCNSRAVYDSFRWWERALLSAEKLTFIPNGVDFDRIDEGRRHTRDFRDECGIGNAVLISTAGSLTEQKDHRTLLRAMAAVEERTDRGAHLCIAGSGPLRSELETMCRDFGIEKSVHLLGQLDRLSVYKLLSQTDIYAMPSKWEGFSAAAVEALATSNAAVFSDIPPFTGPYDEVARFHPVSDDKALANVLIDLIKNPGNREELAQEALSLVKEQYRLETVAESYRDLYSEIVTE